MSKLGDHSERQWSMTMKALLDVPVALETVLVPIPTSVDTLYNGLGMTLCDISGSFSAYRFVV